jgi:hypothetical protein
MLSDPDIINISTLSRSKSFTHVPKCQFRRLARVLLRKRIARSVGANVGFHSEQKIGISSNKHFTISVQPVFSVLESKKIPEVADIINR